ncbi:MAG: ATP-dependent zinc metalloprotease FtsH, partial [Tissierellia bacterium]|nr:ATP-dependent zinc metalloprotease FtsH [Tissierellia bacterium]
MDNNHKPKKSFIIYYIIAIVIWSLLFSFIMPSIKNRTTEEISYTKFIDMIENEKVDQVIFENDRITMTIKDDKSVQYTTGRIEDDSLLQELKAKDITVSKEIPREFSPIVNFLLTFILPILIIFGLMNLLMRSATKKMGGNALQFGKSNAKIYVQSKDGKSFEDVAGQDEAKEALNEVVDFLHDPSRYGKIGAVLPKGVLLVGPPGTGKTLLAQAVAGEAKVPFFSISGSEFVEMFVGLGASKVRDLFKQAIQKAPCIVFIDEIDAIGKRRDTAGFSGNDEREQTLNQLLNEMDGFQGNEGVVILAATNRPEILDPALTRPGRFDRQIPVELPDVNGREAILKVHAKKIRHADNIDYRHVALMTAGASGAQLANIVNESALRAVRMGRDIVLEEDLIESVETVIAGQQKKGAVISKKEKELIAYHEVGHALVAATQSHSAPVTKITIIPRTSGALGYTMQVDEEEKFLMSKEELFNKIVTLTGGRAAEEVVFNTKTTGAANDIEKATSLARAMVARFGMTDEFGMVSLEGQRARYLDSGSEINASPGKAAQIDDKVEKIIKDAHEKAKQILRDNIDKLHEISKFLLEKETITGKEFMNILGMEEENTNVDGYDAVKEKDKRENTTDGIDE